MTGIQDRDRDLNCLNLSSHIKLFSISLTFLDLLSKTTMRESTLSWAIWTQLFFQITNGAGNNYEALSFSNLIICSSISDLARPSDWRASNICYGHSAHTLYKIIFTKHTSFSIVPFTSLSPIAIFFGVNGDVVSRGSIREHKQHISNFAL